MAKLKRRWVKASTLLEVIVAMVIIMAVFALAIGIYTNVISSSPTIKMQRLRLMSEDMVLKSIEDEEWEDNTVLLDGVTLQKRVLPYENVNDLFLIEVVARQEEQIVHKERRIVKRTRHED